MFGKTGSNCSTAVKMAMKFDIVGSDDLTFPVTIEGSLTVKELCDKVQLNHQNVLTSIGQGARVDFLLALRYKENCALVPNEVISGILGNGEKLIAVWASTLARVAPGRHKAALVKLAQHVVYANGSFFCTLGIVDSLAINTSQPVQAQDSQKKRQQASEVPRTSAASSSAPAPAPAAAGSGRLPAQPADSESSSESSGSSSSSVSSEPSPPKRTPAPPAQLVAHTVHIADSNSESGSSDASSDTSSASSSSVSSASSSSSSHAAAASTAVVQNAAPKLVIPAAQKKTAPVAKAAPPPRAASNSAETPRKIIASKAGNAAAAVKSTVAMPSPAAPTEKAILAQISSGVAIPSSASAAKKRGARGGKNSVSNKAKTAPST
jgi:hypothetical protein